MDQVSEKDITAIYKTYIETIKGLVSEIKRRTNNNVPPNINNEIRAITDHIARSYRQENNAHKEIVKADGHLTRLLYDCFKQLNVYVTDNIKELENKYYSSYWLKYDNGIFWRDYTQYKQQGIENIIRIYYEDSCSSK